MPPETQIIPRATADSPHAPVRALVAPASPPLPPKVELSPIQQQAFELLIVGMSDTEVAKAIEINRSTIWRWRTYDPNFIAAMNQWRSSVIAYVRDGMTALTEKAKKAVEESIASGNARIAMQVMDKMGALRRGRVWPVDPYKVFGAGVEDEATRGKIAEDFDRIRNWMTTDQGERVAQLLAVGIAIDNQRAGRATATEVLDMAADLLDPKTGYLQSGTGGPLCDAASAPATGRSETPATKSAGALAPVRVMARVVLRQRAHPDGLERRCW